MTLDGSTAYRRAAPAALSALLLIASCGHKAGGGGFPPTQVSIVTVQPHAVPESYEFPGSVEPYRRVEVRARVEGIILSREFTEGTIVTPGQVLYKLDRVRYDAAFRSAQARLANAQQSYDRVLPLLAQHAVAEQDVDNARSELAAAQGAFDQAKKDLDDTDVKAEIEGQCSDRYLARTGARRPAPAGAAHSRWNARPRHRRHSRSAPGNPGCSLGTSSIRCSHLTFL